MIAAQNTSEAVQNIRKQLAVNLDYFSGPDRTTLEILQGHIEDQLVQIEGFAKAEAGK